MHEDNPFFSVDRLPADFLRPGTERHSLRLDDLLLMFISYQRPTEAPLHKHNYSSILYVDQGEIDATVGDQVRRLQPGEGAIVPPGVPHGLTTRTPVARIFEAWYPVPEGE